MKRIFIPFVCLVVSIMASALPKVAVLGIVVAKDIDQSVAIPITETVMEEFVVSKAFTVLDRNYVNQILTEKEFQLSGMVSDNQIVEAGHYLGADYVIAGTAQSVGGSYFLVAKMIEVKSGVIAGQASERGSGKLLVLLDLARAVGKKLAGSSGSVDAALAPTATASEPRAAAGKLSVGFVYGGEAADEGEPYPPEAARLLLQSKHNEWLATYFVELVEPTEFGRTVDRLVAEQGCRVIISPDIWMTEHIVAAAKAHPDVVFEGVGWDYNLPNVGALHIDVMQGYYLTGLLAGALTRSGKIAFPVWERNSYCFGIVNQFALGVKGTNPRAVVVVRLLADYWDPTVSRPAIEAFIKEGCDVIAPTEVPWVFPIARAASSLSKKIFTFGTREPWQPWSDIMVVGSWENWSDLYEKVLLDVHGGKWRPTELSWSLKEGALRLGGMGEPFNPDILPLLRAVRVKTLDVGELTLPDLVQKRAEQMKYEAFEPFTGPIKDQNGKIRVQNGSRLRSRYLDYSRLDAMDWLLDNVRGSIGRP